jgi:hypothetical protein
MIGMCINARRASSVLCIPPAKEAGRELPYS